jgi:L-fuculose-phosphate aldolase
MWSILRMKAFTSDRILAIVRRSLAECLSLERQVSDSFLTPTELFQPPAVIALKEEIVRVGKKLWERQYVDGNGGNISARVTSRYVICTPTLCSKGDLKVEELSLVDLENSQIYGSRPQTSEILLHLEIYKAVPQARAVIHCHPPYATAHAIAGVVPQANLLPEEVIFIGPVALTPYETPGTLKFAQTVLPVIKQHNTILLANHGVVCWADTVTHAEWCTEVIETYCKTVMIASQLRSPLKEIPPDKIGDLLAIKARLGLPDERLPVQAEPDASFDNHVGNAAGGTNGPMSRNVNRNINEEDVERLVSSLTAQIIEFLEKRA